MTGVSIVKRTAAMMLVIVVVSGCGASASVGEQTSTTSSPSTTAPKAETVMGIAQRFREVVNSGDAVALNEFAPTTSDSTRDFLLGGAPYATVDCYKWAGNDECQMAHGIADFAFVVDVASGLVTEIAYVGGE